MNYASVIFGEKKQNESVIKEREEHVTGSERAGGVHIWQGKYEVGGERSRTRNPPI